MRLTPILMTGAALTGAFLSGPAMAQPASTGGTEVETAPSNRTTYTVGLGAGLAPDYEGSDHYEIVPLWNLRVNNLYNPNTFVQILGPRLRSNFLPSPHWQLGLDGQFIKERDHHVHDSAVSDLKSVDPSLMLGVIGGYDFLADPREQLAVQVEARQDVANGNGALVSLRGVYGTPLSESWRIDTSVEGTWASEDYMSNYFGIDAADSARSGLSQHNADAGFESVGFGGSLTYNFSERWSLSGLASYTRLLGDAADSPIVKDQGDKNQLFGGALINYRF
jgi:MipA family protein